MDSPNAHFLCADKNSMIGHGDLFQDHLGDWWIIFLGTRRYPDTYDHLGRETFLAPVEWKDGWPVSAYLHKFF